MTSSRGNWSEGDNMTITRRALVRPWLWLSGLFCVGGHSVAQTKLKLTGEVLKKDDSPIASVLVTAYRGATKIGESTTKAEGKYSIEFTKGPPIDTVKYRQTAYNLGVVNDLCGARDHNINKTLYLKGTNLDLFEAQETLSAM